MNISSTDISKSRLYRACSAALKCPRRRRVVVQSGITWQYVCTLTGSTWWSWYSSWWSQLAQLRKRRTQMRTGKNALGIYSRMARTIYLARRPTLDEMKCELWAVCEWGGTKWLRTSCERGWTYLEQEAFEKCWGHSPLRAAVTLPFARCRKRRRRAMSTTTTRERGDRYGPMEWAQRGRTGLNWLWMEFWLWNGIWTVFKRTVHGRRMKWTYWELCVTLHRIRTLGLFCQSYTF